MKSILLTIALCFALGAVSPAQNTGAAQSGSAMSAPDANNNQRSRGELSQSGIDRIVKEVHHELALQPYYSVFDNLAYKVTPDGTVALMGQVVDPTLKSSAEGAVKHIEGVTRVDNQIEVYEDPQPAEGRYGRRTDYRVGQSVSLALEPGLLIDVAVAEVLPTAP